MNATTARSQRSSRCRSRWCASGCRAGWRSCARVSRRVQVTDFIDGLERDLVSAAERLRDGRPAGAHRQVPLRGLLLAAALFVLAAGSAAGGTLLVLRGSAIPAP